MNTTSSCPQCGSPLPPDAPGSLCPACLLSAADPTQAPTVPSGERLPPAPTPEELAPDFPGLEILELIGRGGMGAVYKARQKNLDRLVALKILPGGAGDDPHFAERFQREAQALARLNHPNIVSVFDFGRAGNVFYFLMEFVDGTNLRRLIRAGDMKPAEALALIPGVCDALQYAHDEGVVHRDIKPENILVDKRGRVKIADFGLAKLLGRENADHALTMSGMTLGTPRYMAPEQLEKPETVDHRADIYSLGVVFYELLTGELPMGRFDPPSKKVQVDVRLDEIVLRSLERDMQRRYQHASEVRDDVEQVKSQPSIPPQSTPGAAAAVPPPAMEMRPINRSAVAGALWSIFGVLTILPVLFFIGMSRVWNGTAKPTDVIYEPAPTGVVILMGVLLVIGAASLIGTPILGFVGLSVIRNSQGAQRGLRLAVYDILVFPTLLLAAGIVAGLAILIRGMPEALVLGIPTAFFACRKFVRSWWFPLSGKTPEPSGKQLQPSILARQWVHWALSVALLAGAVIFLTFEERTVFQQKPVQSAETTTTIGAFDPWFSYRQGAGIHINFLTKSALGGLVAIVAGCLLVKGRRLTGKAGVSAESWLLAGAGLTFLISIGWAIRTLIRADWDTSPIRFAAIPLGIATGLGALVLQVRSLASPRPGWRGIAPEFSMLLLGAAAGAMPWSNVGFSFATAWQYPHGTVYSLLFLAAGLVFLVTGRADKPSAGRAVFLLLAGLSAIAIATLFDTQPPSIGPASFRIHATSRLCGLWFAYGCGITTAVFAALQWRGALAAGKSPGKQA